MVELDDEVYERLKRDADDNRQVMKIICIGVLLILLAIGYIVYGSKLVDISLKQREAEVQQELARLEAQNEVQVREIEQGDLTFDEYIKWLAAKK